MGKLIVWGLLMTAMVTLAEAGTLQFPTVGYPDLRSAVNTAVVGDTIEQIEPGDFSDGLPIPAEGLSFMSSEDLGSARCTIHFADCDGYAMSLGGYPLETAFRGFTITGDSHGNAFAWLYAISVDGSTLRISDVVVDCWSTAICTTSPYDTEDVDGDVFIDHVTIKGSVCGLRVSDGTVHFQNSILLDCDTGIDLRTTWGGSLDNHDNLFDGCYPDYADDATAGPGEFEGTANLNDAHVPIPISDALNRATDGGDLGAVQFEWAALGDLHFLVDGQRIAGPPHMYTPGDDFALDVQLTHSVPGYVNIVTYVVLSVAGEYYFWPSWQQFVPSDPSTLDSSVVEFHTGDIASVLHFTLPATGWSASFDVNFYALGAFPGAEFTPETTLATAQFTLGV